jgi:DNA-binding NarL/FixJ family response regulator
MSNRRLPTSWVDVVKVYEQAWPSSYCAPRSVRPAKESDDGRRNGWDASEVDAARRALDSLRSEVVLIVDDCTLHRENLVSAFERHGLNSPVAAWDLLSLVTALDDAQPSILLLNIATRDCVALLTSAADIVPGLRTIVMAVSDDDEATIVDCAEAGVADYHMRSDSFDDLLLAMQRVASGERSCTPAVSAILLRRLSSLAADRTPTPKDLALTAREIQVLEMLELGGSNQEIAERLSITVPTVKNHVHNLLSKLGVGSRSEAAALSRSIRSGRP